MPTPLELEKGSIAAKLLSLRGKWGWFPEEKFDSVTGRWAHARGAVKSGIYALGLFSLRPSDLCKVFQRWKGILWNYSGHARNHHMLGTSSWASPDVPCGAPVTLWVSHPLCAQLCPLRGPVQQHWGLLGAAILLCFCHVENAHFPLVTIC